MTDEDLYDSETALGIFREPRQVVIYAFLFNNYFKPEPVRSWYDIANGL